MLSPQGRNADTLVSVHSTLLCDAAGWKIPRQPSSRGGGRAGEKAIVMAETQLAVDYNIL